MMPAKPGLTRAIQACPNSVGRRRRSCGFPPPVVNRWSKVLPYQAPSGAEGAFDGTVGSSTADDGAARVAEGPAGGLLAPETREFVVTYWERTLMRVTVEAMSAEQAIDRVIEDDLHGLAKEVHSETECYEAEPC